MNICACVLSLHPPLEIRSVEVLTITGEVINYLVLPYEHKSAGGINPHLAALVNHHCHQQSLPSMN